MPHFEPRVREFSTKIMSRKEVYMETVLLVALQWTRVHPREHGIHVVNTAQEIYIQIKLTHIGLFMDIYTDVWKGVQNCDHCTGISTFQLFLCGLISSRMWSHCLLCNIQRKLAFFIRENSMENSEVDIRSNGVSRPQFRRTSRSRMFYSWLKH